MKVVIIIPGYYPLVGGAEVFAQTVAEYLVRRGDEVDIVTTRPDGSLGELETINGVRVHRIIVGRIKYLSYLAGYFSLLWHTLKLDKVRDYDLIHAVGDGLPSLVATTIKKLRKKPSLITIQGGNLSAGFESNLAGKIAQKIQIWCFKNAPLVHVISHSLAQKAKKLGAENTVVIPNGIDNKLFKPTNKEGLRQKYGFPPAEKMVISVARLHPIKGIDYLIKAVALLTDEIPELRLIIIGEGEQREELNGLIGRLRLNRRVQLLGFIPQQQIAEYLNMADIFVLPSIHEGLGIALIEAMACGVPSVGSYVDGIVDIIDNERTGLLVPPGNVSALAAAIRRLLQDRELGERFREEGLERVKERFLWDSVLQRIDEVYTHLIQN